MINWIDGNVPDAGSWVTSRLHAAKSEPNHAPAMLYSSERNKIPWANDGGLCSPDWPQFDSGIFLATTSFVYDIVTIFISVSLFLCFFVSLFLCCFISLFLCFFIYLFACIFLFLTYELLWQNYLLLFIYLFIYLSINLLIC